jgi:hypothetical protein
MSDFGTILIGTWTGHPGRGEAPGGRGIYGTLVMIGGHRQILEPPGVFA